MDLIDKVNKLVDEVAAKSKNMAQMTANAEAPNSAAAKMIQSSQTPDVRTPRKASNRRVSIIKAANLAVQNVGASRRVSVRMKGCRRSGDSEVVDFRVDAALESATFKFTTTKVPALATMRVRDLRCDSFLFEINRKEIFLHFFV